MRLLTFLIFLLSTAGLTAQGRETVKAGGGGSGGGTGGGGEITLQGVTGTVFDLTADDLPPGVNNIYMLRGTDLSNAITNATGSTDWQKTYGLSLVNNTLSLVPFGPNTSVVITDGGDATAVNVTQAYLEGLPADVQVLVEVRNSFSVTGVLSLSDNVHLDFQGAGRVDLANTARLEIAGRLWGPRREIFAGEGRVRIHQYQRTFPEWFGCMGDGLFNQEGKVVRLSTGLGFHGFRKNVFAVGDTGWIDFGSGHYTMQDAPEQNRRDFAGPNDGYFTENLGAIMTHFSRVQGTSSYGYSFDALNITGQGKHVTFVGLDMSDRGSGFHAGPYRRGGWRVHIDSIAPFAEAVEEGSRYLYLLDPNDAELFQEEHKVFAMNGASHFGTELGQMNYIDSILPNGRVMMHYPWYKDLSIDAAGFYGQTTADFVEPAPGETVTIAMDLDPDHQMNITSIANRLYEYVQEGATAGTYVMRSARRGQPSRGAIPAGTEIMKARALFSLPYTPMDNRVAEMTLIGRRDGITISNCINTRMDRVRLWRAPVADDDSGLWANNDGGFLFTMDECEIRNMNGVKGGQFARSFTYAEFINCHFSNVKTDYIEFAGSIFYRGGTLDYDGAHHEGVNTDYNNIPIRVGRTGSHFEMTNMTVSVHGANTVIGNNGTGDFRSTSGNSFNISNNTFKLDSCDTGFAFDPTNGKFNNNTTTGRVRKIFGQLGQAPLRSDTTLIDGREYLNANDTFNVHADGGPLMMSGNTFDGYFDQVFYGQLRNLLVRDFVVTHRGFFNPGINTQRASGFIVSKQGDPQEKAVLVDVEMKLIGGVYDYQGSPNIKFEGRLGSNHKILIEYERTRDYEGLTSWGGKLHDKSECFGPGCPPS